MRSLNLLLLGFCLACDEASGELLNVQSVQSEIYALASLACMPPFEGNHVLDAPPTSAFGDTIIKSSYGCSPESSVGAGGYYQGTLTSDLLRVHGDAGSYLSGPTATDSQANLNLAILFRVDAGHRLGYYLEVEEFVNNRGPGPYPGTSWTRGRFVLRHVQSGDVLESLSANAGPGPPIEDNEVLQNTNGVLDEGDYRIEVHAASASYPPSGETGAMFFIYFRVWDSTTAVVPSTWGVVKSLYKDPRRSD